MTLSLRRKIAVTFAVGVVSLAGWISAQAAAPVAPSTRLYQASTNYNAPMTLMQKGQAYLAAKQFARAEDCLQQASIEHPSDPFVHYYLANVLVYLKKHPQAVEEYKAAFRLDPYGPVSGYCRKALITYKLSTPSSRIENLENSEPISAAERLGIKAPVQDERGSMVRMLRTQVEREKNRHRDYAESIAATMIRGGETRARVIERDAHDAINETLNSPIRIRPFETPFAALENRKLQIEQMRKEAEEAAKHEREAATAKSDSYKRWSMEHEFSLDETASNLEGQLLMKALPGSAKLRPEGTGLFVRYYGKSSGNVDVHNSVAHFTDRRTLQDADDEAAEEEGGAANPQQRSSSDHPTQLQERTVRGAVIK